MIWLQNSKGMGYGARGTEMDVEGRRHGKAWMLNETDMGLGRGEKKMLTWDIMLGLGLRCPQHNLG